MEVLSYSRDDQLSYVISLEHSWSIVIIALVSRIVLFCGTLEPCAFI